MAMLGAQCSPCCKTTDPCCSSGELPETVTVTFKGNQGSKEPGPDLLGLEFSSCFGSGAAGYATAPGGTPGVDNGSIEGGVVTKGGSGYAKYGRVAPTVELTNESSNPATAVVTLSDDQKDECGLNYWRITSIAITDGGSGYVDGEPATFSVASGDTAEMAATGALSTTRAEPTLTASVSQGSGATFTVTLASNDDDPKTWGVESVSVSGTTSGYLDGATLQFSGTGVTADAEAVATIRTGRVEPTLEASVQSETGSGASLTVTITETSDWTSWDYPPPPAWTVSDITIEDGGTGYAQYDTVAITVTDGAQEIAGAWLNVGGVDEDGAITSVDIFDGGLYFKSDGVIGSVVVEQPGAYYIDGVLSAVTITNGGGRYYREDKTQAPYVADVTVTVVQASPSDGSGAVLSCVVDDDTSSNTFGAIKSVSVEEKGDEGYLGWQWIYSCDCEWIYGEPAGTDYSITAYRDGNLIAGTSACTYTGYRCWPGEPGPLPWGASQYGPLVGVEISSPVKTVRLPFAQGVPEGTPGEDSGPIGTTATESFPNSGSALRGWAIPGRVLVIPTRFRHWSGDYPLSGATMSQQSAGIYPYWTVVSVSVPSGLEIPEEYEGSFANGEPVEIDDELTDEFGGCGADETGLDEGVNPERSRAAGTLIVDENGALTGIAITDGGVFYSSVHSTPNPDKKEGSPEEVLTDAIVPDVTVTVIQRLPSKGTGAALKPTVETNTRSVDFGDLALTVESGGDGYLLYAIGGSRTQVNVDTGNSVTPPSVALDCATYHADEPLSDCSDWKFAATFGDSVIEVAPGGDVTPVFKGRNKCCNRCDTVCPDYPTQVTITLTRSETIGSRYPAGTTVVVDGEEVEPSPIACPADQVELIFDIEQLLQEENCVISAEAGWISAEEGPIAGPGLSQPLFWEDVRAIVNVSIFQPGSVNLYGNYPGAPSFGETKTAFVYVQEMTLWGSSAISDPYPNLNPGFMTIKTRWRPVSQACAAPESWSKSETRYQSMWRSPASKLDAPTPDVGDEYPGLNRTLVRVCKNYDVDVTIQ